MGRLLSVIAGVFVGWTGPTTMGSMVVYVLFVAFIVTQVIMFFWLMSRLQPSPDSVIEAFAPMPLALYVRAWKALWRGEIFWAEVVWGFLRIFVLSSMFTGIVAFLTRFVKHLLQ